MKQDFKMNLKLDEFFKHPTWEGVVAIAILALTAVVIFYLRKGTKNNNKNTDKTISAFDKLAGLIQILLDREENSLNLQSTEEIITASLRQAENTVKVEIMRIFHHNHRAEPKRQAIIKKAISSVVITVYDSCINSLKKLRYKEKSLAEFMSAFDTETFKDGLYTHVFDKGESDTRDMQDTLYYIETYFTSVITNAKSYYSNL